MTLELPKWTLIPGLALFTLTWTLLPHMNYDWIYGNIFVIIYVCLMYIVEKIYYKYRKEEDLIDIIYIFLAMLMGLIVWYLNYRF